MPRTTTAASHPQPVALAPNDAGRGTLALSPMPLDGISAQLGVSSPYGSGQPMQTHRVVGTQGRRFPGRPEVLTASAKSTVVPIKDADSKHPYPHCTKSYLHAKHLKRHLLRHTGDHPYACVPCQDAFSRSDILKRHFQKCSIRRGNPDGVSHLSHPQGHVKNHARTGKAGSLGKEGDKNHVHGLNNMPSDCVAYPFDVTPFSDGIKNKASDKNYVFSFRRQQP
ncbi:zinc finger domain-containing protein [Metarhizium robertsii ARSEF 23]|uniref:Zinc finger domain-containing protein n=1 Tax=Metarhizium robertsii (strain ARSEF 23 / ATCC MYA-3075) TaxID=655844 RepID=E9FDC6_METRA|nr:zinc finger domain-containing protein [Metarhizium robertsii ARSEF 23]EFY94265.1 zinc finger domain-containing protein [Metarhizium robertsii ARSEF 23]